MQLYEQGVWRAACDQFKQVAAQASAEPCVLENIAILEGLLANTPAAVAAYRQYAHLDGVATERAVEAEAIAQLLDPNTERNKLDVLQISYEVTDADQLQETLLADSARFHNDHRSSAYGRRGCAAPESGILDPR